jgi:hypothetical protein
MSKTILITGTGLGYGKGAAIGAGFQELFRRLS